MISYPMLPLFSLLLIGSAMLAEEPGTARIHVVVEPGYQGPLVVTTFQPDMQIGDHHEDIHYVVPFDAEGSGVIVGDPWNRKRRGGVYRVIDRDGKDRTDEFGLVFGVGTTGYWYLGPAEDRKEFTARLKRQLQR